MDMVGILRDESNLHKQPHGLENMVRCDLILKSVGDNPQNILMG